MCVFSTQVRKIGMLAGGTGITPMLQIIGAVVREGSALEMSLVFANKSEDDILLRDMIEGLVSLDPISGFASPQIECKNIYRTRVELDFGQPFFFFSFFTSPQRDG